VEETAPIYKHSFSVDEARVSGMSAVPFWDMAVASGLDCLMVGVLVVLCQQRTRPENSAKTLPPNIERRVFPDTHIPAYRPAPDAQAIASGLAPMPDTLGRVTPTHRLQPSTSLLRPCPVFRVRARRCAAHQPVVSSLGGVRYVSHFSSTSAAARPSPARNTGPGGLVLVNAIGRAGGDNDSADARKDRLREHLLVSVTDRKGCGRGVAHEIHAPGMGMVRQFSCECGRTSA